MNQFLLSCSAWIAFAACAFGAPVINEFCADNANGIADQDGANSDWIEIHNPDPVPVNLENWSLTDSAANRGKWRFPAVTLQPGQFLIVFASGKDRRVPGAELHTNFELSKDGEYLALVHPDGQTIATEYAPAFPAQREDFSFGRAQDAQPGTNLIGSVIPSYLVPMSAAQLPGDWNQATMASQAGWQNGSGTGAVGYETDQAQPADDTNIARTGSATQTTTVGSYTAALAIDGDLSNFTHTTSTDSAPRWTLNLGGRKLISSIVIANRVGCCTSRLRDITVRVKDSDNLTVVYQSPLLNPENTGYAYPGGPASLTINFQALFGGHVVGHYIEILRTPDPDLSGTQGQGNADEAAVLSMSEVTVNGQNFSGYTPFITTDVKAAMLNVNTSAFVRWPFTVADPSFVQTLRLRMRYDDAYVAYLNGVEIARRSAPASTWNAAAPAERNDGQGIVYEEIDLNAFRSALVAGQNVLAIHGMSASASDPDFLLQPQLIADLLVINDFYSYLRTPTPGQLNDSTWFHGFVGDTNFSVKRGFFNSPFQVAITSASPDAAIYYTTNGDEPVPGKGTLYTGPITINQTTVLRARAFKPDWEPTNTDTNTYLFLNDVLGQAANGQPPPGWPASPVTNTSGQQQVLDYGMDPNVRSLYGDAELIAALQQIPTLSVVTELGYLFNPATGIYANPQSHGREWERPASMEWLDPSAPGGSQGQFQENFGLRIRGGASRNPSFFKHSFRAYFRGEYGAGKLQYPLFGDRGASEFDVIDLASSQNYSWPTGGDQDTMVRDPFSRETLVATGSPGSRNRHFHLYLNGIYWGVYYFDERPSPGYGTSYFGGKKDDYDVVKSGNHNQGFATEATEGYLNTMPGPNGTTVNAPWRELWNQARAFATAPSVTQTGNLNNAAYYKMLGRNADGMRNPSLPVLVDVNSLIDYMLVIFYTGDGDAPLSSFLANNRANNWFALRDRGNPDRGFIFINHDAEHTLGSGNSQTNRTGPFNESNQNDFAYSNPQWLFQDLAFSPEFRLRVADRAHKHFVQNGGVMTTAVSQSRFDAIAAQINQAVKAHSLRWGDAKREPPFNATNWQSALTIARNWLNNRNTTVIQQLQAYRLTTSYPVGSAPLYPTVAAPVFTSNGGNVPAGFSFGISAPAGEIYFSVNGEDPRNGTLYSSAVTLSSPGFFTVKARARVGVQWSAMTTASFTVAANPATASSVVVSELHYHPLDGEKEFIELQNISSGHVDLSGARFTNGIDYTIPDGTVLAPGGRLVIQEGEYLGALSNSGERLRLVSANGEPIRDFTFLDVPPWPTTPDGSGPSLVLIAPSTNPDHNDPANWRASVAAGGNPGNGDATAFAGSPGADADGDGLTALLEYAFGTSDASAGENPVSLDITGGYPTISFPRAAAADDVSYTVEYSTDLVNWHSGPNFVAPMAHGPPTATWRAVFPIGSSERMFLRVKAALK